MGERVPFLSLSPQSYTHKWKDKKLHVTSAKIVLEKCRKRGEKWSMENQGRYNAEEFNLRKGEQMKIPETFRHC